MGRGMAVAKVDDGEALEICTECRRDPRVVPKGEVTKDKRGRVRPITLAEWAAKVKVVANGLCARDYQRKRRGSTPRDAMARSGVPCRYTVRTTEAEKELIDRAVAKSGKSESAWCAEAMVTKAAAELAKKK